MSVFAPERAHATTAHVTGTAGLFLPATGSLLNTTNGTGGYSTPMPASTVRTVTVEGAAGLPSSGISAVEVSLVAHNATSTGYLDAAASDGSLSVVMTYDGGGLNDATNSAIIPVGSDGKIQFRATTQTDLIVDVEGYYTAGNGTTAPGGYVPMNQVKVADTVSPVAGSGIPAGNLVGGSTYTVNASDGGTNTIPADAQEVFVDFMVTNASTSNVGLKFYAADATTVPSGLAYFEPTSSEATVYSAEVPLSAAGKFDIYVYAGSSYSISLRAYVEGYWVPGATGGSFTPASGRLLDTRTTTPAHVAAKAHVKVQVDGVAGVPPVGSGISAISYSLTAQASTTSGEAIAWPDGAAMPAVDDLSYDNTVRSNLQVTQLGTDGAIDIYNNSDAAADFTVYLQGWYTDAGGAISSGQTQTLKDVTLQGSDIGGGSWVTYSYRVGTAGGFTQIPADDTVAQGTSTSPSSWPQQESGTTFTPYVWDVAATLGSTAAQLVQVEACYGTTSTATTLACAAPQNITYSPGDFGDAYATTPLGPGSLSLLTGDFEVSASDAAVSSSLDHLSIGRTLTTLTPASSTGAVGVFGPGWTTDLSGPDAGDATLTPADDASSGYIVFTDTDGSTSMYESTTPVGVYPTTFVGVDANAADGVTVTKTGPSTITMTDPDGTVTTWTKPASTWQATSVAETGSSTTASYVVDSNSSDATYGLVTRIIAPYDTTALSCTDSTADTTLGCRSLKLAYENLGTTSSPIERLQKVTLSAPQAAGTAHAVDVAAYDYTSTGLLADAYDPRLAAPLKTAYTYGANGRLASLTPPGQTPWVFSYDGQGRVQSVSRQDSGQTAATTVVYGVPYTGASAPSAGSGSQLDLSAAAAAGWGETSDLPATGTAVFPATHTPASTTASAITSADWPYATVHYLDATGREVNTAEYDNGGWQVTTTQFDANGNDVWDLAAGNRAQALSPTSATDPLVAAQTSSATRANLLASTTAYNPQEPSEVTDTYGPTHPTTLSSGTVVDGQDHTHTDYDQAAPAGEQPGLPTTVTNTVYEDAAGTDSAWPDEQVTTNGYAAVGSMTAAGIDGWTLREPTTSTVQITAAGGSSDLTTTTVYDAQGRTIQHRLPADTSGTAAETQNTSYYTAGGSGACVNPAWAGLTCSVGPAAQPSTGNPLPVTTYRYDSDGNPLTTTETAGSTVRTTIDTYDAIERLTSEAITVTPAGAGGTAVPTITDGYDPATGLPTATSSGAAPTGQTVTAGYDALGRETSYTDANGKTTTTAYDLDGNPVTVTSPAGTTTYTYDSSSEHRGLVTSENINVSGQPSTFQASYDPDGSLTTETYPNGLTATTTQDNAGEATRLAYAMGSSTWMTFTQTHGLGGRVVTQSSPVSSQVFGYDPDGRLTTVQDTIAATGNSSATCTTRAYTFDADSNRVKLDNYAAASDGTCTTQSTDTGTSSTFDQADRITNPGYAYDTLGRTTTVPAADASGIGSFATATGALTLGYYANDMTASESQDGQSVSFGLDPLLDRVVSTTNGSTVTTNDYGDDTDSPSSSTTSGSWTRYATGPDGDLDATITQAGIVTLDLVNLQGDEVATAADSASDTGITAGSYSESTEYGAPRNPASAPATYGWLGGKQRSADNLGGLIQMGVRLYDPATGRFLSVDPVYGGNANPYIYPADPITGLDLTGKWICDCGPGEEWGAEDRGEGDFGGGGGDYWRPLRHTEEQAQVVREAKEARTAARTGHPIRYDYGEELWSRAQRAGLRGHGPETHEESRPGSWSATHLHISIGPIRHIEVMRPE
ncbi:RHS repeat-associated core domain-containing protein [Gryllotalpicola reticulitermitis]|uniref:RHS repeat-associated core domain-containing protein n=1 Tax=Gryllotalpicola reticulitermitis TaxID=1184153 RepID=A0ABV8Q7W7_9MICO